MKEAFGRLGWVSGVLGVVGLLAPAHGVTFSFKAVKKNATVISPAASVVAAVPGDTIEINVFVSGWNANIANSRLQTYQYQTNARKGYYNNGGPGFILPKGWNAVRELVMCDSPFDCLAAPDNATTCSDFGFCTFVCVTPQECMNANPAYPLCDASRGFHCVAANHCPEMGAFIGNLVACPPNSPPCPPCTTTRADNVFVAPLVSINAVSTQTLDYAYAATVISGGDGALDTGVEKYLGTLILEVAPGACGTYKVGAINDIGQTFADLVLNGVVQTFAPTISELTVNLPGNCGACCMGGECSIQTQPVCLGGGGMYIGDGTDCEPDPCVPCPTVLSSTPPNCAIDARFPNSPTAVAPRLGFTQVDVTYSAPLVPAPTPASFIVAVTPDPGVAQRPVIESVQMLQNPPNTYRITLQSDKPVPTRAWTCITFDGCAPGPRVCLGALPLDASQNRVAELPDLTTMVNGLNGGQAAMPANFYRFDMDRSGAFTTVDLVNWVDMAIGAGVFPVLIDKTIDLVCPSAAP